MLETARMEPLRLLVPTKARLQRVPPSRTGGRREGRLGSARFNAS